MVDVVAPLGVVDVVTSVSHLILYLLVICHLMPQRTPYQVFSKAAKM